MEDVQGAQRELVRVRTKKAVWLQVIEHLELFVSTDSYQPKQGIRVPETGDVVPQEQIREVIQEVRESSVGGLEEQEAQILTTKLTPRRKTSGKKAAPKKAAEKKAPVRKAPKRTPARRRPKKAV